MNEFKVKWNMKHLQMILEVHGVYGDVDNDNSLYIDN